MMHGKVKTAEQILRMLHSLQKAMTDRTINKTQPYAKEIDEIQNQLIECYSKMGKAVEIVIDSKRLDHYQSIVNSLNPMLSVTYLKQYISLNGKDGVNSFRYTTDDLRTLIRTDPNMIFVCIFQTTKDGNFKGSQEFQHDVDVVIRADNETISTQGCKNRFGGNGEMKVW